MAKRLKICYIISDIDKALAFEWIADGLDTKKFELHFILILPQPSFLSLYLKQKGVSCQNFYYTGKADMPRLLWQVLKKLIKVKPAIVHCHLLYGSLLGLTAAKLAGIGKRIYTRHHSDYHQRYFPKGIKWDKWCNRMATNIVAPSEAVKEVLMKYEGVAESKITVIHHGFDLSYFEQVPQDSIDALRHKYGINDQYPVVGVISRFTALKGIQYIIPAFRKLLEQYPKALLLLFGAHGDYESELNTLLAEMPKRNYQTVSFENNLSAVYPLFDVFIQVSIDRTIEAFGQTYVEALAAGVPSVFTLSGIANDFIKDGENALVVPYKDANAIYAALSELMNNKSLREKLSLNGRNVVKKQFDLKMMIQKLENLYDSA